jgi:hypothetical protein
MTPLERKQLDQIKRIEALSNKARELGVLVIVDKSKGLDGVEQQFIDKLEGR